MNSRPRSGLAATRLPEGRRRPGQSAAVVAKAGTRAAPTDQNDRSVMALAVSSRR